MSGLDRASPLCPSGRRSPSGLYPKVAISVREPFADLWGSQGPTWYVYRDGSILPDRRTDATSV